jgi:hypothetical protein
VSKDTSRRPQRRGERGISERRDGGGERFIEDRRAGAAGIAGYDEPVRIAQR